MEKNLSGDANDGCRIQEGISQACNEVHGTWARGCHGHANFAGSAGITFGSVHCPLLVAGKDVPQAVLVIVQGIVNGHNGPTGVAKYGINPFLE
jgi:hypothetical protein